MVKMMKNFGFATIVTSIVLFTGCGGNEDNNNAMNSKEVVVILKDVPSGICESEEFRNILSEQFTGIITEEKPNTVTCADYEKTNDNRECGIEYYTDINRGNVACVVGADGFKKNVHAKVINSSFFATSVYTRFIQIAE